MSSRRLQDLISDAGRSLGRSREQVKPFLAILEENWYDSVDSLRRVKAPDLQELGIPQRFAKELLLLVEREGGRGSSPIRRHKGDDKGKGKGKGRDDKGGKSGKGKGKDKDREKGSRRDDSDRDWPKRNKGKGTRKGEGKNGMDDDEEGGDSAPPSQRSFAHTHKIHFDIDDLDENFPLGARIIGRKGRNVQHIRKVTGAWVWLAGKGSRNFEEDGQETEEPLHIVIKSDDVDSLEKAIEITNDLVDTVLQQYQEWCSNGKEFAHEEEVSKKGSSKGKRNRDHDDPPIKRSRRD
eukprot:TRINITY_DN1997_c0_g5_i1.p1 TRINITY_DN1997_c0_g5~~TRINITY_DN1997_c0_g5_i1.p1  ORF type:complete len:294 (-),score=55.44 TRINITY_DN1997_c0_g5_i1:107-988(-)